MISEQQIESVSVMVTPSFKMSEASFEFPVAIFSAVSLEMAVSIPEAQREKQTE